MIIITIDILNNNYYKKILNIFYFINTLNYVTF